MRANEELPEPGTRILHLADRQLWAAAQREGDYRQSTRELTLEQEGFLHASTAGQIPGVIDRYYTDVDLAGFVLLVIDAAACVAAGSPVRLDPVGNTAFPHIYGPLPVAAVVAELPVGRDADGGTVLPDLAGLRVAD